MIFFYESNIDFVRAYREARNECISMLNRKIKNPRIKGRYSDEKELIADIEQLAISANQTSGLKPKDCLRSLLSTVEQTSILRQFDENSRDLRLAVFWWKAFWVNVAFPSKVWHTLLHTDSATSEAKLLRYLREDCRDIVLERVLESLSMDIHSFRASR